MKLKYILFVVYSVAVALLLTSVIHSGYQYLFDPDELFHVNVVFLLQHGMAPYRDFFITYTPLFHWFLAPVSYVTGFTFRLLEAARVIMIVLFITRLTLIFFIIRKLFGQLMAFIALPLSLFDSFTAFSAMQVRPDNLMMTLYLAGVLLVVHWYMNKKSSALPWAGLFLGLSVLTLLKNIPATFIITLFVCIELVRARNFRGIAQFLFAMILPAALLAVWSFSRGLFPSMLQQVVFDGKMLNDSLRYPENILNYYWPPNFVLYGSGGRPLTWVYELCLPLLTFAGMFTASLQVKSFGIHRRIVAWFTAACLLQWVSLLFVRSVFLQYFLSVSWFLAAFAAYALTRVYESVVVNRVFGKLVSVLSAALLVGGLAVSWQANTTRSKSSYAAQKAYLAAQWSIIPESTTVFPGAVFRRSVYPLGYETNFVDLSPGLLTRYGSPSVYLARYRIPFVVIDPYNFSFLDAQTQEYIRKHYQQNVRDQNMWSLRS